MEENGKDFFKLMTLADKNHREWILQYAKHKIDCNSRFENIEKIVKILEDIKSNNEVINDKIESLNLAIYGDPKNKIKGIIETNNAVNELIISSKVIRWTIIGIFAFAAGVYGIISLFKEIKN